MVDYNLSIYMVGFKREVGVGAAPGLWLWLVEFPLCHTSRM